MVSRVPGTCQSHLKSWENRKGLRPTLILALDIPKHHLTSTERYYYEGIDVTVNLGTGKNKLQRFRANLIMNQLSMNYI